MNIAEMISRLHDWIKHHNISGKVVGGIGLMDVGLVINHSDRLYVSETRPLRRPRIEPKIALFHARNDLDKLLSSWCAALKRDLRRFVKLQLQGRDDANRKSVLTEYAERARRVRQVLITAHSKECSVCPLSLDCLVANWRTPFLWYDGCLSDDNAVYRCVDCRRVYCFPEVWGTYENFSRVGGWPRGLIGRRCPRGILEGYCHECGGKGRELYELCERMHIDVSDRIKRMR